MPFSLSLFFVPSARRSGEAAPEVNRLVCLGNKASNIITTDLEGSDIRRFLDNDEVLRFSFISLFFLPAYRLSLIHI